MGWMSTHTSNKTLLDIREELHMARLPGLINTPENCIIESARQLGYAERSKDGKFIRDKQ